MLAFLTSASSQHPPKKAKSLLVTLRHCSHLVEPWNGKCDKAIESRWQNDRSRISTVHETTAVFDVPISLCEVQDDSNAALVSLAIFVERHFSHIIVRRDTVAL